MKTYNGYLIDLDGTIYRGTEVIDGALQFIAYLQANDLPFLFVTNNSSRTPEQVAAKLREMGFDVTAQHVFTTSQATAIYIAQTHGEETTCYVIGEEGIKQSIADANLQLVDDNAQVVVMGIDRDINYEKLTRACLQVRRGATFIATNVDVAIPTERGLLPGNGSLVSVVRVSTGVEPIVIGKPETIMMEQALAVLGTTKEETLMVGDNYATDIMAGIQADIDTLYVATGVTSPEQLATYEQQPTHEVESLLQWLDVYAIEQQ